VRLSSGHRKIILYSVPGKEPFRKRLQAAFGFRRMTTAMAIFEDPETAFAEGLNRARLNWCSAIWDCGQYAAPAPGFLRVRAASVPPDAAKPGMLASLNSPNILTQRLLITVPISLRRKTRYQRAKA